MANPSENESQDPDEGFDEGDVDDDVRTWVRDKSTGDLGYLVTEGGLQKVHLDRPMVANLIPYDTRRWAVEPERRPMTRYQLAAVAYDADQALCRSMGIQASGKPWSLMTPDQRMEWRDHGPAPGNTRSPRGKLWSSIMTGMRRFVK